MSGPIKLRPAGLIWPANAFSVVCLSRMISLSFFWFGFYTLTCQGGFLPDKIEFLIIKNKTSNKLYRYPIVIKTSLYTLKAIWQDNLQKLDDLGL